MTEIVAFPNENSSNVDARGLKRQSSVSGTDPLKKSKVEDNVIILEDGSPSTSSGYVTPLPLAPTSAVNSVKRLTPKLSKEEREAERIRKALQKRLREEERERAKAEKEKIAEEKRLEKERKEKEREEKRKEDEKKKEEKRREEEERKERKRREEEEKQKKKEELAQKKREEEERREAKRKEEEERKESSFQMGKFNFFQPFLNIEGYGPPAMFALRHKYVVVTAIEEKKRRASARFIGFFSKLEKKKPEVADKTEYELWYKPFEVKDGMKLAPIQRRHVLHLDDDILKQEDVSPNDYLLALSKNPRKLVGVTANPMRAKLYQFHDNYRPPYYGTWRIRSKVITGRRPFTTEDENIDYEVDSDAEWEDEPSDAEECKSDEEDDAGGDSDVDSDHDSFFVEPGYLSAGEGDEASDDDAPTDAKDAEERRERLAARAREWNSRVLGRRQPGVLVPRCVGPLYCSAAAPHTLAALRVVLF
uniref:Chromatin assembly factor 1 subunit A n=1 Tax=Angiostrongylus cantonensis TaxID=6313 RepID=A0A158P984_ANGCA